MPENEPIETKTSGGGLMGMIRTGAIVSVLVVVEMAAAMLFIPSAAETEALAREMARASQGEDVLAHELEEDVSLETGEEMAEVNIGIFNVTRYDPESDASLNIDFEIYGVVLASEADLFQQYYEPNRNRLHEQIIMTMHGAESSDLSSAGLGLIKRRILERSNRALGKSLLHEIVFTKINFVER
ncbi:hypothetical protein Mal64_33360 [Pseudobythopirellula maris]|uniref:Flagellar protein FliL n=1 Tax=Pseudobythopirellula maris TaxID=2527991 RepID=A0A5C5ZHB3_9BACT|nr:hypothetical protein [Pseudobythopirellula maris]TWT86510.1 hypothetical protein Mal64_33360 [Pseudobythopirellula maris]